METRIDPRIIDVVGRMHVGRITGQMLAKECGYNPSYVSEKRFPRTGRSGASKSGRCGGGRLHTAR